MFVRICVLLSLACVTLAENTCCLPFNPASVSTLRAARKKSWGFYFPIFPLSIDNVDGFKNDLYAIWNNISDPQYSDMSSRYALNDRPRPRLPRPESNYLLLDMMQEVRYAIGQGLDGWVYECKSISSDSRWNRLPLMLKAAEAVDPNFKIILSVDNDENPNTADTQELLDATVNLISESYTNTSMYKTTEGQIVLGPWYAEAAGKQWYQTMKSKLLARGISMVLLPIFLDPWISANTDWNSTVWGYSTWSTRWPAGQTKQRENCELARSYGKLWMHTISPQDVRRRWGTTWEASNSLLFRSMWETAISCNADWINLITWSDYSESTCASGTLETGWLFPDLTAYYNHWFKLGSPPTIVRDALYYIHRTQWVNATYDHVIQKLPAFIFHGPEDVLPVDNVELVAFLQSPGTLTITQGSNVRSYNALNSGLVTFAVPLIPGTTPSFKLSRNGQTVVSVTSQFSVKNSVIYQDMAYKAGGGLTCDRPGDTGNGYYACPVATPLPTPKPTPATPIPTSVPTAKPTLAPTPKPTLAPTPKPTSVPTSKPTSAPTPSCPAASSSNGKGLRGDYFNDQSLYSYVSSRIDPNINFDFGLGGPNVAGISNDQFSIRWTGRILPRFTGLYTFYTSADDNAKLFIGGQLVVDDWVAGHSGTISLTAGIYYDLELNHREGSGGAVIRLLWSHACELKAYVPQSQLFYKSDGLTGSYYTGNNFENLVMTRIDSTINFNWGTGAPFLGMLADVFSANWTGYVLPKYTGTYTFYANSDNGVRLYVNEQTLVDDWVLHGPAESSGSIALTAGRLYNINLQYYEYNGDASISLLWSMGSTEPKAVIPTSQLFSA